jgi:biotin-dependent carboxylase-like uncharacterized protein
VVLEVVRAGLHDTIQDAGRPDAAPLGVPRSGACDPLAMAAANLLVGGPPDSPVLEVNLLGPTLLARSDCLVALAGADLGAHMGSDDALRPVAPGSAVRLSAGERLELGSARDGARACLAIAGGFAVAQVLGSASTAPVGGFGGFAGRALRVGDVLMAAGPKAAPAERHWPGPGRSSGVDRHVVGPRVLRAVPGPHAAELGQRLLDDLLTATWTVSAQADRVAVRLDGPALAHPDLPEPLSMGMAWGAIEVPRGGAPIILLADHPTVGGYRVPLVVASVDRPALGQLRAGDEVRLLPIDLAAARSLASDAAARLGAAAERLGVSTDAGGAVVGGSGGSVAGGPAA